MKVIIKEILERQNTSNERGQLTGKKEMDSAWRQQAVEIHRKENEDSKRRRRRNCGEDGKV